MPSVLCDGLANWGLRAGGGASPAADAARFPFLFRVSLADIDPPLREESLGR